MPTLHPTLAEILAQPENPNAVPVEKQHPDEARREWKADMAAVDGPAPEMEKVWDFTIPTPVGGIAARGYRPSGLGAGLKPLLVYYHGGGFIRGDLDTHDSVCRVLADAAKCLIVSAAYRLAPEHRFPAAAHDAYYAVKALSETAAAFGADKDRIAVGGDSAGGNLAIASCLQARDGDGPRIAAQLLIYPVTDLTSATESKRLYSKGYLLNSMPFYTASYVGPGGDVRHKLASPLLANDLARLPPAIIITAGFDPLRDEGQAFAAKLAGHGVSVDHRCYDDMIHGFVSLRGLLPEADEALRACGGKLAGQFKATVEAA